jgi:hypothetical protein
MVAVVAVVVADVVGHSLCCGCFDYIVVVVDVVIVVIVVVVFLVIGVLLLVLLVLLSWLLMARFTCCALLFTAPCFVDVVNYGCR